MVIEGRTRLYKLMRCINYGCVGGLAVVKFDVLFALLFGFIVFGVNIIFSLLSV